MNVIENKLTFHPRFKVSHSGKNQILLLSEKVSMIYKAPLLDRILEAHDQGSLGHQDSILKQNPSDSLQYLQTINQMQEAGLLIDNSESCEYEYLKTDFSSFQYLPYEKNASRRVSFSSDQNSTDLFFNLELNLGHSPIDLVLLDDYLDPRVKQSYADWAKKKRRACLFKLSGERLLIGPLFTHQENHICYTCMGFRMEWNQPMRFWKNQTLDPLPSLSNKNALIKNKSYLEKVINDFLKLSPKNFLYEVDIDLLELKEHHIIKRPQCPSCGEPALFQNQIESPIELQPSKKVFCNDGGVRTCMPSDTNQRIKPLISPLTGSLAWLGSHTASKKNINTIYRSAFYKQAYNKKITRNEDFLQYSMGKGMSHEQSQASALSEAIERLSSNFHGDESIVHSCPEQLNLRTILPQDLMPFSDRQYQTFLEESNPGIDLIRSEKYDSNSPLAWTKVWSMTHKEHCYVPFTSCFANSPYKESNARFFHNGGSAGNTLEEAILQGLFELIERDAVAIWWYNKCSRPAIDIKILDDELLQQINITIGEEWEYWLLDLTHDFSVPVFAAISRHRQDKNFCLGFGCHLDVNLAAKRAATELCQIMEIREKTSAPFDFNSIKEEDYLLPSSVLKKNHDDYEYQYRDDIVEDIEDITTRASKLGLETLAINTTRPDLVLHTVKIMMPGMCHLFPYFAAKRLYQVPYQLGWVPSLKEESEMNPNLLLI